MNNFPTLFLFSGQGAHHYGMGEVLYREVPVFKKRLEQMDEIVKGELGISLINELYGSDKTQYTEFSRTMLTHPSIFMVEYALSESLQANGVHPKSVFGSSLGAYCAAVMAGAISMEDALKLVIKQAQYIEAYCMRGKMTAVLDSPNILNELQHVNEHIHIAGINLDKHFVISYGHLNAADIERALKQKGITFQSLNVSHAFHSPLIDSAKSAFLEACKDVAFKPLQLPFYCAFSNTLRTHINSQYLWDTVREPMDLKSLLPSLATRYQSIDVGPSGTMATFLKHSAPEQAKDQIFTIMNVYGHDLKNFSKITEQLEKEW